MEDIFGDGSLDKDGEDKDESVAWKKLLKTLLVTSSDEDE